ncbi:MAG: glycosyltransferase family 4 protein [Bryobacterales bacterium]|nr:glycosyltransferase family 4 protein [Bryobacterales bacterium]
MHFRRPTVIALDATYSVGRALSGVGVYCREILHGLARLQPEQRYRWCYRPHRLLRGLRQPAPTNVARRLLLESVGVSCSLYHGLNQRLPNWTAPRHVVTFHDLFVLTGEYSTREFRERFAQQAREAAERADLIICVSAHTASQVEALLGVERARLRVVWHGMEPPAGAPVPEERRENLVLHVGALQKRKNIVGLIHAFEHLDSSWRLLLAGSTGYGWEEIAARLAASPARERIEIAGYVDDAGLQAAYRRARILAFPSFDEGFGIPVLEAMGHGLPVLTSNGSALAEVAGDAAVLVDPKDAGSIAEGMRRLAADAELRRQLSERGLARALPFTWNAAAARTWDVYRELLA